MKVTPVRRKRKKPMVMGEELTHRIGENHVPLSIPDAPQ
jgi:hypothetical protein